MQEPEKKQKPEMEKMTVSTDYPNIPHELVIDIISRLPVKSLARFISVSKSWQDSIKNPSFAKMHFQHASSTQDESFSLMIGTKHDLSTLDFSGVSPGKLVKLDYPFKSKTSTVEILASCNGLFCIRVREPKCRSILCLWNPSTSECKELPAPAVIKFLDESEPESSTHGSDECEPFDIDYYECYDNLTYGLGYDDTIDDYKLVRVEGLVYNDYNDSLIYTVQVYTLGSNTWKRIEDVPYGLFDTQSLGVHVNGFIHWLGNNETDDMDEFDGLEKVIVALDLRNGKYEVVPLPHGLDNKIDMKIGAMSGCLYIMNDTDDGVDIWMMKRYGVRKSWKKLLTIGVLRADSNLYKVNKGLPEQVSGQTGCGGDEEEGSSHGASSTSIRTSDELKLVQKVKRGGIILNDGQQFSLLLYGKKYGNIRTLLDIAGFVEAYVGSFISLNSGTYWLTDEEEDSYDYSSNSDTYSEPEDDEEDCSE